MRTTRTLAIAAALGLGMVSVASANVVYDSETTNEWFNANIKTSSALSSEWTCPKDGEAAVKGESNAYYIALDTDLDDPLTYAAARASEPVAIVAAEMTATVNASVPELKDVPQAALCVIGTASATNWVGLIGDGNGGTNWVTFSTPVPVAGETYSVRIEFDQRQDQRKIRYRVGDTVLGNGWYPNPKATDVANIQSVSFSGSGDIAALTGENITENTLAFRGLTQTNGFDYTNGTISISADIQGYENVTAELKLVDFTSGAERSIGEAQSLTGGASWDLSSLTAGGTYGYTIVAKDAGGHEIATQTGTFTAAKWPTNIWFGADASKSTLEERVKGGSWNTAEPAIEGSAYVIEEDALFNVTDQKPGSNHVTRVDTKVTFETLVDVNSLQDVTEEEDALGGFVAAKSGETPQWMALTKNGSVQWVALTGDIQPAVNVPYVVRAEVDFISDVKRVRFLVSDDDGVTFAPLSDGASQWIALATQEKYSLAAVELKGSGKVAKFEATVANKALAVVDGVEYDSMDEALAAAKDGTKSITLLTNATIEPKEKGSYDIAPGTHQYVSGGKVSSDPKTIVVTEPGQPPVVRPSTEEMKSVKTPAGNSYKDINSLRDFLERHGVAAYTGDLGYEAITQEMNGVPTGSKNNLPLWEDYVMGIEPTDSVTPEYTPSADKDTANFSLQVPALGEAIKDHKPSGDYAIKYKINQNASVMMPDTGIIPVTLPAAATDYNVSIVLEPIK